MGEQEGENVAFSVDMMGSVMILSSGIETKSNRMF